MNVSFTDVAAKVNVFGTSTSLPQYGPDTSASGSSLVICIRDNVFGYSLFTIFSNIAQEMYKTAMHSAHTCERRHALTNKVILRKLQLFEYKENERQARCR